MSRDNDPRTTSGVPPAPKLTFPTQYNGQKRSATVSKPQWKPVEKSLASGYDPVTGRLPQAIHDFVLDVEDFRLLNRDDRMRLLEGTSTQLTVNEQPVASVPLRLLLAASQEARNAYLSPPQQPLTKLNINTTNGSAYSAALQFIAEWMKETCTTQKAYYMSLRTFVQDVYLLATATAIGMELYALHINKRHYATLKNDKLELLQLLTIEKAAPDPQFSLLTCILERLSNELVRGERARDAEFIHWMRQCPKISKLLKADYDKKLPGYQFKMQAIANTERKAEEKDALKATAEMSKRLLAEQHQRASEQKKRDKEVQEAEKLAEKKRNEDLARRLNSGGRVNTVTAEEAKLLRCSGAA
jgi:hypothetical protein